MFCRTNVIPVLLGRGANAGPIEQGGRSLYELALDCLGGAYENFDDLPAASSYESVIRLLQEAGLSSDDDISG